MDFTQCIGFPITMWFHRDSSFTGSFGGHLFPWNFPIIWIGLSWEWYGFQHWGCLFSLLSCLGPHTLHSFISSFVASLDGFPLCICQCLFSASHTCDRFGMRLCFAQIFTTVTSFTHTSIHGFYFLIWNVHWATRNDIFYLDF